MNEIIESMKMIMTLSMVLETISIIYGIWKMFN